MDKFGIFNLINSLLTPKSDGKTPNSDGENGQSTPLSTLLNSIIKPDGNKNAPANDAPATNKTPPANKAEIKKPNPLQASMLSTMKSHDEFIKRVNGSNKIQLS